MKRRPRLPFKGHSCVKPATNLVMYPRPGIATAAAARPQTGPGAGPGLGARSATGPQRPAAAIPAEMQQFYQCCACNELFISAKNVRIHFALMQPGPVPRPGPGKPGPASVTRRVRQPHGASDALKAAHFGVAVQCQWQLVQINPAARAVALGGRRGTEAQPAARAPPAAAAGAGGPGLAGPAGPTGRTAAAEDSRQTDTDSEMHDGGGCGSLDTDPGTTSTILHLKLLNIFNTNLQPF